MARRGVHVPQPIPGPRSDPGGWPVVVEDFLADLAARGYSPATVRARRQALAVFAQWCLDRGLDGPAAVSRPVLVRYQRWLFHYRKNDGDPLTFRSQNARLLPVRALFAWCVKNGHLAANPASDLDLPKVEQRLPKAALTAAEAEAVLAVPDERTISGLRDRCMLEVLYCTGIRRSELARLNIRDIDRDRKTLMVRQGKGKKDRLVPIHHRCITWLNAYLTDSRPKLVTEPDDGTPVPHRRRHRVLPRPVDAARPGSRESLRGGERGGVSLVPAHPGHGDVGRWGRYPVRPSHARPRRAVHDPDLRPGLDQGLTGGACCDPPRRDHTHAPLTAPRRRRRARAVHLLAASLAPRVACCCS